MCVWPSRVDFGALGSLSDSDAAIILSQVCISWRDIKGSYRAHAGNGGYGQYANGLGPVVSLFCRIKSVFPHENRITGLSMSAGSSNICFPVPCSSGWFRALSMLPRL